MLTRKGHFDNQCDALLAARFYIRQLPPESVFALTVTEEAEEDTSILNIYVPSREKFTQLQWALFSERRHVDSGKHYVSYRVNTLLISIIVTSDERIEDDRQRQPD